MFLSGVVVSCRPEHFEAVGKSIAAVPGVEIHQRDAASGRFVVVIAEDTIDAETERFQMLRTLNDVVDVSLVVHREVSDEEEAGELASTLH